jgi:hypothetical protein
MHHQAIDPSSPAFSGGFGKWRHTFVSELRTGTVGRPREDAVYSTIWLDVRAEPWWCRMGAVSPDVSFAVRLVDLWGFLVDDFVVGHSVQAPVLMARPTPVRDVPGEVGGIVHGESGFLAMLTAAHWRDPFKLPGAEPVRPDIVLEPVTVHLGRVAPKQAPDVAWWPWSAGLETTDEYWSLANFALSLVAPSRSDRSIFERIAEIGVVPGRPWDAATHPDHILEAIREGMDDSLSDLMTAAGDPDFAETTPIRRADLDSDYFRRAVGALKVSDQFGV